MAFKYRIQTADRIRTRGDMQRREFIGLVGSAAAAWPLASRAQQTPMPVIGLLTNGSFERSRDNIAAFHQGLARTGYIWVGSSRKDYREFPPKVQDNFGFELFLAQTGQHPPSAKLLKGLGSGIMELVDDFDGDTFRAVYTVRFESAVYVLHSFKKKSKQGIKTPQSDIELIKRRLKDAEADYAERRKQERKR